MRINPIDPSERNRKRPKRSKTAESHWASEFGTDADYQAWCRKRPSAYSGKTDNVVYAHYRTAANSGIGIKPPYSGIPLTLTEHNIQHRIGEYNFMERARWEFLVDKYLNEWVRSKDKDRTS